MSRALVILLLIGALMNQTANSVRAKGQTGSSSSPASVVVPGNSNTRLIDSVAARIGDDIITESEVRELAAFQRLVDGHAKSRPELIEELADQWITSGEAHVANYPEPAEDDVNRLFDQLRGKFSSPDEFNKRVAAVGLTEDDVRRLLAKQLYLSRFLDYRFRAAAQVDQKQIEAYYNQELVPKLQSQGQPIPPLEDVQDTIQEVLVQRMITDRATAWLDETRARLKIEVLPEGEGP
jgi:hypothetical protein